MMLIENNIMYERFHTCAEYYFSAKTKPMFIYLFMANEECW